MGEYTKFLPALGAGIIIGYAASKLLTAQPRDSISAADVINPTIRKELPKVYDEIDVEDLGAKTNFCRCWRSKKVRMDCLMGVYQDFKMFLCCLPAH